MKLKLPSSLPSLSSLEGSTLLPVIIIGAVVTSSLMLSPSFFNSVQDKILVQDARRRADDEILKIQTFLQYPSICKEIMQSALKFQGPNTSFKTPQQLFTSIKSKASLNGAAPLVTEAGWGESHGEAFIDIGNRLFNGTKIHKATVRVAFSTPGITGTRAARTFELPVYLALGPGNDVEYCELFQISGSITERLSTEDRVCRLQFGAAQPDILYNPLTTLCQSPSGT